MSSETIMNRTPETVGQRIEREKLGLPDPSEPVTADAQRAGKVGQADFPVPAQFVTSVDPKIYGERSIKTVLGPSTEESPVQSSPVPEAEVNALLEAAKILVQTQDGRDLAKFKEEVIQAFKHLGLDTRKHFGV